jgi:hypothetical protein
MSILKAILVAFSVISLVLAFSIVGCSGNESNGNGEGNSEINGDSTITGEIIGILTYTTTMDTDPVSGIPIPRTTLERYTPAVEDEDENIFLLSASDLHIDFEYTGMSLNEATTTIADYTYTDHSPFNDESKYLDGKDRQISHTGIYVIVTGTIDTVTGYISGKMIDVTKIEETS